MTIYRSELWFFALDNKICDYQVSSDAHNNDERSISALKKGLKFKKVLNSYVNSFLSYVTPSQQIVKILQF